MKKIIALYFVLFFVVFSACQPKKKQNLNQNQVNDTIQNQNIKNDTTRKILVYTKYKIPLPVEFYHILKKENVNFNQTNLNPTENLNKYNTSISKSINFGIYASDLAYCSVFEQNQMVLLYFNATRELARDLRIDKGYSQDIVTRLKNNIEQPDSLVIISDQMYWAVCNHLESNNQINILPFIITGGWLESFHLIIRSIDIENPQKKYRNLLLKQEIAIANLRNYLMDVMMDSNAFEVNDDIQTLDQKLAKLETSIQKIKLENQLSTELLNELKKITEKVREYYIK